ncbi:hypothetical protein [Haliangium sp.]|uniref:hypothetical protein n=1 Tax=Haliangium sp. TaxID=2663208 RepID=UPI003D13293F
MLEFFHEAPSVEDVRECVRKQHQLSAWRTRTARAKNQAKPPMPRLWILAAGTPEQVLEDYAFQRMDDWPAGCWAAAKALALHVVALRELPEVRATLTLRLFGAGPTFVRAVRELAALPEDASPWPARASRMARSHPTPRRRSVTCRRRRWPNIDAFCSNC